MWMLHLKRFEMTELSHTKFHLGHKNWKQNNVVAEWLRVWLSDKASVLLHHCYLQVSTHANTWTAIHQQYQQREGWDGGDWSQLVLANTFHCTLMTAETTPPTPKAFMTLPLTPLYGPPGIPSGPGRVRKRKDGGEARRGRSDTDEGGHSRWWDSSEGIGSHEYINW